MARKIRLSGVAKYAQDNYEKLLRTAVVETYGSLIKKSPVDQGRFQVSWAVGENEASFLGEPANRDSYPAPNPKQPRRIGYAKERAGNNYIVYNNLPYAVKLETAALGEGSSVQTNGPGWVRATAKRVQSLIPTLAARINAES